MLTVLKRFDEILFIPREFYQKIGSTTSNGETYDIYRIAFYIKTDPAIQRDYKTRQKDPSNTFNSIRVTATVDPVRSVMRTGETDFVERMRNGEEGAMHDDILKYNQQMLSAAKDEIEKIRANALDFSISYAGASWNPEDVRKISSGQVSGNDILLGNNLVPVKINTIASRKKIDMPNVDAVISKNVDAANERYRSSISSFGDLDRGIPAYQNDIGVQRSINTNTGNSHNASCKSLIYDFGESPSGNSKISIGSVYKTALQSYAGIGSVYSVEYKSGVSGFYNFGFKVSAPFFQESAKDMASQDTITVSNDVFKTLTPCHVDLFIPISKVTGGKFFILFEGMSTSGEVKEIQQHPVEINVHSSKILHHQLYPIVNFSHDDMGWLTFEILSYGCPVAVYKKDVCPLEYSDGFRYSQIGLVQPAESGTSEFTTQHAAKYSRIYRFVLTGDQGDPGNFVDVVVAPRYFNLETIENISEKDTSASFIPKGLDGKIDILLRKIPATAVGAALCRKNITLKEKDFSLVSEKIDSNVIRKNTGGEIKFTDTHVLSRDTYEYNIKLFYSDGTTRLSSKSQLVEYISPADFVTLSTSNVSVRDGVAAFEYSVNVSEDSASSLLAMITSILGESFAKEFYSEDFNEMRERLATITAVNVDRYNISTGQVDHLGVFTGGAVIDDGSRVSPPFSGHAYEYKCHALVRSAIQMIEEIKETEPYQMQAKIASSKSINPNAKMAMVKSQILRGSNDYFSNSEIGGSKAASRIAYKMATPISDGFSDTMTTGQSLATQHPESSLELGKTGVYAYVRTASTTRSPTISGGNVTIGKDGTTKIKWEVDSDASKIDYFVIIANRHGIEFPIGVHHHAQTATGGYLFLLNDRIKMDGIVSYSVKPVFNSFNEGQSYNVGSVVVD